MLKWDQIRGQEVAKRFLSHAVEVDRIPHAVLFTGPSGVGKFGTALTFAQRLNCESPPSTGGPCGSCRSCAKVESEQHPDVRIYLPTGASRTHKIKDMRELQRSVVTRPFEGRYQILIIVDADRMTIEAANALLKTLEEPPGWVSLILTSDQPAKLLDTIISRCQEVRFRRLPTQDVVEIVQKQFPEQPAALLANLSAGSPGRAFEFVEDDLLERRQLTIESVFSLDARHPANTSKVAAALIEDRKRTPQVLEILKLLLFDLAATQSGYQTLVNADYESEIKDLSTKIRTSSLHRLSDEIDIAARRLQRNSNALLLFEHLLNQFANAIERPR